MKLKNINEIKEDGLTVFMPSGIQATLFNEGDNILVKYYNLREDRYSVEDFKELITEGIFIFNDLATGKQIIESMNEDYSIGTVVACQDGSVHTIDDIKHDGNITIYLCDTDSEGFSTEIPASTITAILQDGEIDYEEQEDEISEEWCVCLKDGTEEWFQNRESADEYFDEHENEVEDYYRKVWVNGEEDDVEIIYRNFDESVLKSLTEKGYIRKSLVESFSEDLEEIEAELKDQIEDAKEETKIEIEIKDDKVEIEGEIDGKEFEVEQPLDEPQEEPAETEEEEEEEDSHVQDDLMESVADYERIDLTKADFSLEVGQALEDMANDSEDGCLLITPDEFQNAVAGMNDDLLVKLYNELGLSNFEYMLNNKDYLIHLEVTNLDEADENGEDTIESFFGLKETDFGSKEQLIKHIQEKTDYDVISSDNLSINVKDRTNPDAEEVTIALKHEMKEAKDKYNTIEDKMEDKITEGYDQKDCKPGAVFTAMKNKKKEYLTNDFKIELLGILDRLSKEFPDIAVRKQAREWMDELGLQEYYNTDKIVAFARKYIKILDRHIVDESLNEDTHYKDNNIKDIEELKNYFANYGAKCILDSYDELVFELTPLSDEELDKFGDFTNFRDFADYIDSERQEKFLINITDGWFETPLNNNDPARYVYKLGLVDVNESLNNNIEYYYESLNEEDDKFNYMLLDRLRQDCEYFLGFGNRNEKRLWAGNVEDQIAEMRKIYDKLPEKPEWISLKDIDNYERQMLSKDESLNEGMWASPFTVENAEEVAKLLSEPITFAELNSEEGKQRLWNVIGDDNFWDGVEDMAIDFPENDAREWIADMLKAWMINKDTFKDDAYSLEAEQIIRYAIRDNLNEDFENNGFEKDEAGIEHLLKDGYMHSITKTTPDKYRYNKTKWNNGSEETVEDKKDLSKEEVEEIIDKELNEEEKPFITLQGTKINLEEGSYKWLDKDTFYFQTPSVTDKDNDKCYYYLIVEWHEDEQRFTYEVIFEDEDGFANSIDGDKPNQYLSQEDKAIVREYVQGLLKQSVTETLQEASSGLEKIANDLQDGKKEGFEPIEYGNWKCTCSLDDKWETFTESMKAYILNEIGYQVNVGDLEFEDLEISIDYDDCLNADMDSNDIESLNMFDDVEILDMINNEFKPLTFLISYNIEFDNKIEEDCKVKKSNKKALKENLEKEEWYIVDINGEVVTEFYDTQEEAEKDCERMNADKDYADNSPYTVESRILDEQFKVKDKKKKKKKIDDNLNKEVGKMKKLTEDAYKVYNTIENRECGTFNSWNDVQNFLNQEWGSYSADKAKENPNFGSEEDKANFFGNYSMDLVQLPVAIEEPATNCDICACEPETCDGCADIEVPADAEVIDIPAEVSTEVVAEEPIANDLDAFIALIVDDEEPVELTCPDCNQEPCVCEQPAEVPAKEIEASVEEPIEEPACEVCGCNPCQCVNETKEETEEKNEEFKDNMGMLTDIQDTDFPDALKSAVDTKEDGTLYKIGDIAKEIEELKASFKTEIENIKAEIKTALSDIKQDIKDDVKDIQIDVTSKLDNTNSKIADLTSEEELEDEDLDLENEEPAEEENLEEEPVENEEEDENGLTESDKKVMVQQYINQNGAIYENIKNVIRTSPLEGKKMSITTVAEKLREEYGINTRVGAVYENVALICEYSPVSKYIIDEDLEKSLLTTQKRGIANKFIKTGLQDMWANQKKEENFSNLKSVLTAQSENLDQAKKAIDKLANQDGNAEKMKKAIELTTDNDQEKEQALDYAVDKIDESYAGDVMSKLLSARGALGGIASVQGIGVNKK